MNIHIVTIVRVRVAADGTNPKNQRDQKDDQLQGFCHGRPSSLSLCRSQSCIISLLSNFGNIYVQNAILSGEDVIHIFYWDTDAD